MRSSHPWRVADLASRPVSRLTAREIEPAKVLAAVKDPSAGAVVLFLGTVRDSSEAGSVERIEYEAYAEMAERRLAAAEEEARVLWPHTKKVAISHRVGNLGVGEVSVAVAVSSPHRAEAFEACRHIIEAIKHDVPIWKKERLADGTGRWVEGAALRPRRAKRKSGGKAAARR